jgi:hypothetical protein
MIIECPTCEAKTECLERGAVDVDLDHVDTPTKFVLLECKVCQGPLLGITEIVQTGHDEWEWEPARRLWPVPEKDLDDAIPDIAKVSLVEAKICFKAQAFSACAVMCGRAIEGVCMHHDPSTRSLAGGLKKLRDAGLIDERIYTWGEALRENRNLGAHATTDKVSRADAQDLLDFSLAICEYVFVLHEKFERFQKRRAKLASPPAAAGAAAKPVAAAVAAAPGPTSSPSSTPVAGGSPAAAS